MISGDLCHTLVDELVVVHDASLPLPARFANTTSPQACKAELGILSWKGSSRASNKIFTPGIQTYGPPRQLSAARPRPLDDPATSLGRRRQIAARPFAIFSQ
jgi:hypothetical protein